MSYRALCAFIPFVIILTGSSYAFAEPPSATQEISEEPAWLDCQTMPANISAGRAGALVLEAAAMSETFRRQCATLARAAHLTVQIYFVGRMHTSLARATTEIWRRPGKGLMAIVHVPVSTDAIELLAHEFEHLVEELDGVCLQTMLANGEPGVTRNASGAYETFRAKRAGLQVAAEVARATRLRARGRSAPAIVPVAFEANAGPAEERP
jgi:hypothetical protein